MAEIIWTKDGQGQFDFDYLLNLTNQDFVDVITNQLSRPHVKSIKVMTSLLFVEVFVVSTYSVRVYNYHQSTGIYDTTSLNDSDLLWILEVMQSD